MEVPVYPVPDTVTVLPTAPVVGFVVITGDGIMTKVNVCDAVLLDASVAWIVCTPAAAAGTVNETENEPAVSVVITGVVTVLPSNFIVIVDDDAYPVPVTVVLLPTTPAVGFMVTAGTIVNIPDPELIPSDIRTVCAPVTDAGTIKIVEKEPAELDVVVVTVEPSYLTVIVDDPVVPLPDTVTVLPTAPVVGFIDADGMTENNFSPNLPVVSVAEMRYAPVSNVGTVNVAENEPAESVVIVPGLVVTILLPNFIVTVEVPVYPVPDTVTVLPTFPA